MKLVYSINKEAKFVLLSTDRNDWEKVFKNYFLGPCARYFLGLGNELSI
jgi:hypothetical protein